MDIKSPQARSRNMARIKYAKTKPEMYIRSLFFRNGMRFRVNFTAIEGKPDLYFTKHKVAVFVHGCYWHRHENCKYAYTPKSNVVFWITKLESNRDHDIKVIKNLNNQNIRVLIIWECTTKKMRKDPTIESEILRSAQDFIYNIECLLLEL